MNWVGSMPLVRQGWPGTRFGRSCDAASPIPTPAGSPKPCTPPFNKVDMDGPLEALTIVLACHEPRVLRTKAFRPCKTGRTYTRFAVKICGASKIPAPQPPPTFTPPTLNPTFPHPSQYPPRFPTLRPPTT